MVSAIILDYDGIIRHLDMESAEHACSDKEFSLSELMNMVWTNQYSKDLVAGRIDRKNWWSELQSLHPVLKSLDQSFLWDMVYGNSYIDTDVLAYIGELRQEYNVSILSNADLLSKEKFYDEIGDTKFDHIFVSAEFGCIKPDKEIFIKVLEKLERKPEACIFLDDQIENVEAAQQLGIQAYHYSGLDQMKANIASNT